jgi:hypothetical protein
MQRLLLLRQCLPYRVAGDGMALMTTDTFARPDDLTNVTDARVLYARSYLLIRVIVGLVGILMPTSLFLLDAWALRGGWVVKGSLSAYYHSGARDLFVGALCVTGFLLITYMAAQRRNWDYWLSTIAGIAVLGVALLPTSRPRLSDAEPLCGTSPTPAGCTQLQQAFGETAVAVIHFTCAAIFILSLAALCFLFARREQVHAQNRAQKQLHLICGGAILLAVAWVGLGRVLDAEVLGLTPLYLGEIVSVYAFGVAWIAKGRDLLKAILG